MRIISGSFKGKKIIEPKDNKTRPLKDLTKESIFNIIKHSNNFSVKIENSYILDLFSGVGSFGIDCLSRGAKEVIFVENYNKVLPILKKNLLNLKSISNYRIIEKNIYDDNFFYNFKNKFEIIFLDPPYKDQNLNKLLLTIRDQKIIKDNGILIMHRNKNTKDFFSKDIKIINVKEYGISKIYFLSFL